MCTDAENKTNDLLEQLLANQAAHQFTRTRFASLILNASAHRGIQIGQGKCKAIRLKANSYKINSLTRQDPIYFYYGDKNQQSWEYVITLDDDFTMSNPYVGDLIYCQDLQDVWVRLPTEVGTGPIEIQIEIFD